MSSFKIRKGDWVLPGSEKEMKKLKPALTGLFLVMRAKRFQGRNSIANVCSDKPVVFDPRYLTITSVRVTLPE